MKWTIRNVEPEAIGMIAVMAEKSGWTYGELVSDAISVWYDNLPYEDENDWDDSSSSQSL